MNIHFFKSKIDYFFVSLIIIFPLFLGITDTPIFLWDEARLAINSLEMLESGNYLVTTFDGIPDMWNTKPPFLIWIQCYLTSIFGPGELSLRLPSVFSAYFLCIFEYYVINLIIKNKYISFFCVLCLIGSEGFMSIHGVRTGDYDSLLTMFTSIQIFSFFLYVNEKNLKYLILFVSSIILACLTKGIAGLLFTPSFILFSLYSRKYNFIYKDKKFYLFSFIAVFIVALFYIVRNLLNPGYFLAILNNELSGRFLTTNEGHNGEFFYYIENFINYRYNKFLLIFAFIAPIFSIKSIILIRNFVVYVWSSCLIFILIISISKTKLPWYDIPLYPLLSFLSVFSIFRLIEIICTTKKFEISLNMIFVIVCIFLLLPSYNYVLCTSLGTIKKDYTLNSRFNLCRYFKNVISEKSIYDPKYVILINEQYAPDYLYYQKALKYNGINVEFYNLFYKNDSISNKFVIIGDEDIKNKITSLYETKSEYIDQNVTGLEIIRKKNPDEHFANYDINLYDFNKNGVKLVPHKFNKSKVLVLIKKKIYNFNKITFVHCTEKINSEEKLIIRDIVNWKGIDIQDSLTFSELKLDGEFVKIRIGQHDDNTPLDNWEQIIIK